MKILRHQSNDRWIGDNSRVVKPLRPISFFEQRILALTRQFDTSPAGLGVKAGLSKNTVQKWIDASNDAERRFSPQLDKLQQLADFCGVTVEWLIADEPFTLPPEFEPSRADTREVAERLARRGYPRERVYEILMTSQFHGARDANDIFDATEAQLSAEGFTARFRQLPAPGSRQLDGELDEAPRGEAALRKGSRA